VLLAGRDGKALPADLERFILLAEVSGGGWKQGLAGIKESKTKLWIIHSTFPFQRIFPM
jgi:hypothetical protein